MNFPSQDLPPIEDLKISVADTVVMTHVGSVSSVVDVLLIVKAQNTRHEPLSSESVLFLKNRKPLGRVRRNTFPSYSQNYMIHVHVYVFIKS